MTEIETDRLFMRPFVRGDLDVFATLHGDAEVMASMRSGVRTRDQAAAELDGYIRTWDERGFGIWALFDKAGGDFVGECGFWPRDDGLGVGLRVCLARRCWGRGLASEAGRAALDYAFDEAGLERIVAVARAANLRSRRAMEKIGMTHERTFHKRGSELMFYALSRDGWREVNSTRDRKSGP